MIFAREVYLDGMILGKVTFPSTAEGTQNHINGYTSANLVSFWLAILEHLVSNKSDEFFGSTVFA